ncbi:MAG TPA: DJ-1/PfpI family protein [Steroidobacteraceae bacterium]|nr:DJ-1/PfpI family protein [Steroidobacteraceae bacterium]
MNKRHGVWIGTSLVVVIAAAVGLRLLSKPPHSAVVAPEIGQDELAATLAALKPPKRHRPVIAVIGINDATETTDYLMPTGILRRADVADVMLVATGPGPVKLYPALTVEPDTTVADFDSRHPEGADFVIVPAMIRDDDPAAVRWIKDQSAKGATIIGVCYGVKVVAEAGLLDHRRGTTHWYALKELRKKHPSMEYVPNRRIVANQGVVTTTGITASIPMSLTLIEAIAGREKAETVAKEVGLDNWDARHASDAFRLTLPFALTVMGNRAALWNREQLGVEVSPGIDEVSLALAADAWSRTYRSRAVTFAASSGPVATRSGIRILPDHLSAEVSRDNVVEAYGNRPPAQALDQTLSNIETRYGARTRYIVAMQLEYPRLN